MSVRGQSSVGKVDLGQSVLILKMEFCFEVWCTVHTPEPTADR